MKFREWLWMKAKKKGKEWACMLKLSIKNKHFWFSISLIVITASFFGGIVSITIGIALELIWFIAWILSLLYDQYKEEMRRDKR